MKNPSALVEHLATQIRHYRTTQGLTQADLAHRAGVTVETIARIERILRGRDSANANPSLETMERIAESLNLRVIDLLSTGTTRPTKDRLSVAIRNATPAVRQRLAFVAEALIREDRLSAERTPSKRKAS